MTWFLAGLGAAIFVALTWFMHRHFNTEPPQVHSNVKPSQDHDPAEVVKATFIGIPPAR